MTISYEGRTKESYSKRMDRLEHLGIIQKGLTGYSSPVVLVK